MLSDSLSLHFWIRWLHVAAMAVVLGGAILLWGISLAKAAQVRDRQAHTVLLVAGTYEWFFWAALGLLVMTGVGNLGTFGAALPPGAGAWGMKLLGKLLLVLLLMVLSLVRTLVVARLHEAPTTAGDALLPRLQRLYAGTTLLLSAILVLAVSLAHGG